MREIYLDIETFGLDAEKNAITCIGFLADDGVHIFSGSEKKMIKDSTDYLSSFPPHETRLVTFNGTSFDLPFIRDRINMVALLDETFDHYIDVWNRFMTAKERHVDLLPIYSTKYQELISKLSTGRLSKSGALQWMNIYEQNVPNALHCVMTAKISKDWSPILLHNSVDLFSTKKLFDRAQELGWV